MSKRLAFFLMHLSISFLITFFIVGLVFFIWYPMPLAHATNVIHIVLLILIIDVILGPILGLIVYKEGKKTLKFDLSIIFIMQFLSLGYGVHIIENGRPVWIAYYVNGFELIRKNEIIDNQIRNATPEFQHVPLLFPQYVAIEFAKDPHQRNEDKFAEIFDGISLAQRPDRYVDIKKANMKVRKYAINLDNLEKYNSKFSVKKILSKYPEANAYLPLKANALDMTVLINKDTAEIVKIVDLRPWK